MVQVSGRPKLDALVEENMKSQVSNPRACGINMPCCLILLGLWELKKKKLTSNQPMEHSHTFIKHWKQYDLDFTPNILHNIQSTPHTPLHSTDMTAYLMFTKVNKCLNICKTWQKWQKNLRPSIEHVHIWVYSHFCIFGIRSVTKFVTVVVL